MANEMDNEINRPGSYRIEVSGWGLDQIFFVEQTDLLWSHGSEKRVALHHTLPEGAIIFVRLLTPESTSTTVPVAYQADSVQPTGSNGLCEIRLTRFHPRTKESNTRLVASNLQEETRRSHEASEIPKQGELEEILQ